MRRVLATALICTLAAAAAAQERPIPKDSLRLAIPGCAKDRRFIVTERPGHEPVRSDVRAGRRFRLNGKKEVLQDIKAREGSMIEITGLVRQQDLTERGIRAGGVRIDGGPPRAPMGGAGNVGTGSGYSEVVLDVESFRMLPDPCPNELLR